MHFLKAKGETQLKIESRVKIRLGEEFQAGKFVQAIRGIFRIPTSSTCPQAHRSLHLYLQQLQLPLLPQWLSPYAQTPIQGYKQNLRNVWHTFIKLLLLFSLNRIAQPKIHKRGFNFHCLELGIVHQHYCHEFHTVKVSSIKFTDTLWRYSPALRFPPLSLKCTFAFFPSKDFQVEMYIPHLHLRITFHQGQGTGIVSSRRKCTGTQGHKSQRLNKTFLTTVHRQFG